MVKQKYTIVLENAKITFFPTLMEVWVRMLNCQDRIRCLTGNNLRRKFKRV